MELSRPVKQGGWVFGLYNRKMQGNELNLSSVLETESPWKEKATSSLLSKVIKLEKGDNTALIIKDDCNKPIRFMYLAALMSKKNSHNMNILINRIVQIKNQSQQPRFINMTPQMNKLVGSKLDTIHEQLIELHKRLQNQNYTQNAILKLVHQFAVVDLLLIISFRILAEEAKAMFALDCSLSLSVGTVETLLRRFFVDKGSLVNSHNKFVIFYNLSEIEVEFLKGRGVSVLKQSQSLDELSDSQTIRYEEYLMIEKVFSLL